MTRTNTAWQGEKQAWVIGAACGPRHAGDVDASLREASSLRITLRRRWCTSAAISSVNLTRGTCSLVDTVEGEYVLGKADANGYDGHENPNPIVAPVADCRWPAASRRGSPFHSSDSMLKLPEQFELIGLFEVEPIIAIKDVPWEYNHLTFTSERDDEVIHCEIELGYEQLWFRWVRLGNVHVDLHFVGVVEIKVISTGTKDALAITLRNDCKFKSCVIQIRPFVSYSLAVDCLS